MSKHNSERFARFMTWITTSETVSNYALFLSVVVVMFLMVLAASEPTYVSQ